MTRTSGLSAERYAAVKIAMEPVMTTEAPPAIAR
jgi:hypothetical protein